MPIFVQIFEEAIRFRLETRQKKKLYAEAKRRNIAGADLLRELIDTLPEPPKEPEPKRAKREKNAKTKTVPFYRGPTTPLRS